MVEPLAYLQLSVHINAFLNEALKGFNIEGKTLQVT